MLGFRVALHRIVNARDVGITLSTVAKKRQSRLSRVASNRSCSRDCLRSIIRFDFHLTLYLARHLFDSYPINILKDDIKSSFKICTGCRNRTHANGFGDHCTTTIRIPHIAKKPSKTAQANLFSFFMVSMLFAMFAIFFHF